MNRYAYAKIVGTMILSMSAQWLMGRLHAEVLGACSSCGALGSYRVMRHIALIGACVTPSVLWVVFVESWQRRHRCGRP